MIDAKQLRIGNLLYYKNTTYIANVELIHNNHFDCRDEHGLFTPNGNYEPIPLTEEILLKCPQISKQGGYPYRFLNGFIKIRNGVFFFKYYKLEVELPYLHSFQNLVFQLTGEELEINL